MLSNCWPRRGQISVGPHQALLQDWRRRLYGRAQGGEDPADDELVPGMLKIASTLELGLKTTLFLLLLYIYCDRISVLVELWHSINEHTGRVVMMR